MLSAVGSKFKRTRKWPIQFKFVQDNRLHYRPSIWNVQFYYNYWYNPDTVHLYFYELRLLHLNIWASRIPMRLTYLEYWIGWTQWSIFNQLIKSGYFRGKHFKTIYQILQLFMTFLYYVFDDLLKSRNLLLDKLNEVSMYPMLPYCSAYTCILQQKKTHFSCILKMARTIFL